MQLGEVFGKQGYETIGHDENRYSLLRNDSVSFSPRCRDEYKELGKIIQYTDKNYDKWYESEAKKKFNERGFKFLDENKEDYNLMRGDSLFVSPRQFEGAPASVFFYIKIFK